MTAENEDNQDIQEQLAEALAQVEAYQAAAADAEAQAVTATSELSDARERISQMESDLSAIGGQLMEVRTELIEARAAARAAASEGQASIQVELDETASALAAARNELSEVKSQLSEARGQVRDASLKYREAKLAASPHIPPDLVPGETVAEIDQQMESAARIVLQMRERLRQEGSATRAPLGSPVRRAQDLSALSPAEKIKRGLSERG